MMFSHRKKPLFLLFLLAMHISLCAGTEHRPPVLTTSAIIEIYQEGTLRGIAIIERGKEPFGLAMPGGKVEYGETTEDAVRREMQEEVHLDLYDLQQFHVYGNPDRDPRHHSVEVTYLAKSDQWPEADDDAAKVWVIPLEELPLDQFAFDHGRILQDYLRYRQGEASLSMLLP